jgi:RNA polymerase sigma factor (sigma-70 family)
MKRALSVTEMVDEQDQRISETVTREQARLRNFIRRRVQSREDAEDILQDVFSELVEAYRLMHSIEQVGAWLFRVARNRITDLFRKKRPEALQDQKTSTMDGEQFTFVAFIKAQHVRSVVVTDGIIGCPHEEGVDYPEGKSCPMSLLVWP